MRGCSNHQKRTEAAEAEAAEAEAAAAAAAVAVAVVAMQLTRKVSGDRRPEAHLLHCICSPLP